MARRSARVDWLRSRFEDFTGVFVLHCPIFNHEDIGMTQLVEVYRSP